MAKKPGRTDWKKKRLLQHLELKEYRYYIFCEGEQTEPQYFAGFKRLIEDNPVYKNMVLLEIEPCAAETLRIISMAEKYVKEHNIQKGQIWCVYDKDSFPAEHFNGVVERINVLNNKLDQELQYHAAWSNECIEFWFILHFAYYASNNHRTEYINFLNTQFKKSGLGKYRKNSPDIFNILLEYGNPKLAIQYARRLIDEGKDKTPAEIAPGTRVHELVEELARYLPEKTKERFLENE